MKWNRSLNCTINTWLGKNVNFIKLKTDIKYKALFFLSKIIPPLRTSFESKVSTPSSFFWLVEKETTYHRGRVLLKWKEIDRKMYKEKKRPKIKDKPLHMYSSILWCIKVSSKETLCEWASSSIKWFGKACRNKNTNLLLFSFYIVSTQKTGNASMTMAWCIQKGVRKRVGQSV